MNILGRIVDEHERLIKNGRKPDSLFLSKLSLGRLSEQAQAAYDVAPESVRKEFLGMKVFVAEQYLGEKFRIYCEPQFSEGQNAN